MTTLNLQPTADSDTAKEYVSSGTMSLTSYLEFGFLTLQMHIGVRWTGTSAIAGATINSAQMQFYPVATDSGAFDGDWYGHDSGSPGTFTTTAYNISDTGQRPRTATTFEGDSEHLNDLDDGDWTVGTWAIVTGDDVGGSLKAVIQYLADTYTPTAVVLLHIYEDGNGERYGQSGTGSTSPKLDIDYTAAGAAIASRRLLVGHGR